MTVVDHYWEHYHRQWQQLITTGNVVTGNDSSWSLLGTLSQTMTAVDHYGVHSLKYSCACHAFFGKSVRFTVLGITVTGNDSCWSLLGTLSQAITAVDHYWKRCHGQWQQLITTRKVVTGNDSSWSLLGTLSQAMTVVNHYWERCHRQWQ